MNPTCSGRISSFKFFCTSQDLGTVHERYKGLRTTLVCEEGPGHIPFKKSWKKKKEEEIKAQKNQKNSIHLEKLFIVNFYQVIFNKVSHFSIFAH